jgi:hypothetical protein
MEWRNEVMISGVFLIISGFKIIILVTKDRLSKRDWTLMCSDLGWIEREREREKEKERPVQDNFVLEYEYDPQINEEYKHVK